MLRALPPHEFLAEMLVPGYGHVYALGCFARYATIYSQQVRAINLVDSLCRSGCLPTGTRVAVVGGSTAGLTAAAAAALRGAAVNVFEKGPFLFPIQDNPARRFLHPHIYDWPLGELHGDTANLPVLNWKAGDASNVFDTLKHEWQLVMERLPLEPVRFNAELIGLKVKDGKPVLQFADKEIETDIAILAIGFGLELDRADLQRYWQSDPLDTDLTGSTVLISGAGDGALTDLMRLCIQDFKHEETIKAFAANDQVIDSLKNLLGTQGTGIEPVFKSVAQQTGSSFGPQVKFRTGIDVILNAPDNYLGSSRSSILNRFIVYLLEKDKKFRRRPGELKYPIPAIDPIKKEYQIELVKETSSELVRCHRLLVRHGPERDADNPKMPKHWNNLAPVWDACSPLRQKWDRKLQGTDRTLVPMFSNSDYNLTSPKSIVHRKTLATDPSKELRCFVLESSSSQEGYVGTFIRDVLELHCEALGRAIQRDLRPSALLTESKPINRAIADEISLGATIEALAAADVAIIDVTGFEPGVMLLLGIRSVLRQGVTVITTNEEFTPQHWSLLPFNLKELYPLHIQFSPTDDINSSSHPFQWLGVTIANALTEMRALPQYLDSPAHEDVRRLGPSATYFGRIPTEGGILWLCPFAKEYMEKSGNKVQVEIKKSFGLKTRFERVTDMVSPQLMSQRLYSAIRRRDLCVVDWTTWSPNVFYELGVRLAVNRFSTVSILADGLEMPKTNGEPLKAAELEQRQLLTKIFAPIQYGGQDERLSEVKERHDTIIRHATTPGLTPPTWGDVPFDYPYRLIAKLSGEIAASARQDVERLLQSQAAIRLGTGGTTDFSSPVLYADANPTIAVGATATATEMLLAAWFYLSERLGFKKVEADKLTNDAQGLKGYLNLGERVIALLTESNSEDDRILAASIQDKIDTLRREMRKGGSH